MLRSIRFKTILDLLIASLVPMGLAVFLASGKSRDELTRSPDSPVLGNPDGDVAVVEFFDYRCPYCKLMATRGLIETLEQDGNVRIVMKEFPILGDDSLYAAKAALASSAMVILRLLRVQNDGSIKIFDGLS